MKNESTESNGIVCAKLSLERCQKYLAHLHALMYMCEPRDLGMDEIMSENARRIMSAINQELMISAKSLNEADHSDEKAVAVRH
jgi:hypothetical protein